MNNLLTSIAGQFAKPLVLSSLLPLLVFDFALNSLALLCLAALLTAALALARDASGLLLAAAGLRMALFAVLAGLAYAAAVDRAHAWGVHVKAAVDLYRRDRMKKLGYQQSPADIAGEKDPVALEIAYGHGTHVAGIIAGEMTDDDGPVIAITRYRDENGNLTEQPLTLEAIAGMAPRCKLLSLKVMDDDGRGNGTGRFSSIIHALHYTQRLSVYGRLILVDGVNLSVGHDFEPEWFACGQSPLCTEVNRLVRSGVVVIVAAGNSGYGFVESRHQGTVAAGLELTINDPGNAELSITVGSTHRYMPHVYGVSYFSSKGPTGDGRMKPAPLAPGEKIISCASGGSRSAVRLPRSGTKKRAPRRGTGWYREDSGTSMAARHVSGAIAASLSIRREFIGDPEEVKRIFLWTATDLRRAPSFQGRGLVDLMRAIQSV